MPLSHILVPVDFSAKSECAARYAGALQRRFASRITLLHVLPPPHYEFGAMEVGGSVLEELFRSRAEQARTDLDEFLAAELPAGSVDRLLLEGDPAAKIVKTAHDLEASLIVMPTHGYGTFRRFILGSVTANDGDVWWVRAGGGRHRRGVGSMAYETILVEQRGPVGLVTLNRPKQLNALNSQVIAEIEQALTAFDADPAIAAVVITGSEKAFAAGADIKEMLEKDFASALESDFVGAWNKIARHKKPIIAAVAGYALGGGCELAMMCDIILAADNARFGQPEINLGTIPGVGGTQRLTRAVGKSKAMEMILTGRLMTAEEAERANLVARVVPLAKLLDEAIALGEEIAKKSQPIVRLAKEAVNVAFETTLAEGVRFEQRVFYATFATADRKEGMSAFVEKRTPTFTHR